jgi:dTDP-4-dehydrorhamnose reductase
MTARLVVCGASGYVGRRLVGTARAQGLTVLAARRQAAAGELGLDLERGGEFDFDALAATDTLVVAAALSAPDACAQEPERAWRINVEGTSALMAGARRRGVRVIFLSSDTVYGEQPEPFDESRPARPVGVYATMKREVEVRFAADPDVKVLRLSYVFSAEDRFSQHVTAQARRGEAVEVFDPFVRACVHRDDVVDAIIGLARGWRQHDEPVFNVGGPLAITRERFVQALRETAWPTLRYRVVAPQPSFYLQRPARIVMTSPRLARLLGREARTLREAAALEFPTAT